MPAQAQGKQRDDPEQGLLGGQTTGDCHLSLLAAANCEIVSGCLMEALAQCKDLSLEGKGESKGEGEQVQVPIIVALEERGCKDAS